MWFPVSRSPGRGKEPPNRARGAGASTPTAVCKITESKRLHCYIEDKVVTPWRLSHSRSYGNGSLVCADLRFEAALLRRLALVLSH